MKKLLVLTLTMAMLFTMTAMAEENIIVSGDTTKDVIATYKEGTDGGTIYSVDIVWGSMEFTYNAESKGVWNPETHTYTGSAEAEWSCEEGANVVKVINHSNAELTANVSFSSTVDGVSGTFDKNELRLATAVGTDKDKAPNDSAYLTLSGELPKSEESAVIGSVLVVIDSIPSNDTTSILPTIDNIEIDKSYSLSGLSSQGIILLAKGSNLGVISNNFDEYLLITAVTSDGNKDLLFADNSESNCSFIVNDTETEATIKYSNIYFSKLQISSAESLTYKLLKSENSDPIEILSLE